MWRANVKDSIVYRNWKAYKISAVGDREDTDQSQNGLQIIDVFEAHNYFILLLRYVIIFCLRV